MDFFGLPIGTIEVDNFIPPCRGHYFRYREYEYKTARGITFKQEFNFMKRYSCSGCIWCGGHDDLLESVCVPNGLRDMDLVRMVVSGGGGPDRHGDYDDPDVEFMKVDEAEVKEELRVSKLPDNPFKINKNVLD